MRTIYYDSEFKCHVSNPEGVFTALETDFFDGKCDAFVEGYRYEVRANGTAVYPWQPFNILAAAQAQHEATLAEMDAAYREGVNSI